jgi:ParB-like chromosome segregation protein Spo0J
MQIREIAIGKIAPYFRNPRNAEKAVPKVMRSIQEFGWRQPIVVDTDMVIVVGHARYLAAKRLGCTKVPVHIAGDLPPEKIKAYRLADNRSHEEATWDDDMLRIELSEFNGSDTAALTGFDSGELLKMLAGPEQQDTAPQLGKLEYRVVIDCFDEAEQTRLLQRFNKEGFSCRALIS